MTEKSAIAELGELQTILHSRIFYLILDEHKKSIQKEVNTFVKEQKWYEAFGAVKRLEDVDKIVFLMNKKMEELKK